jgi:hypothetical protein
VFGWHGQGVGKVALDVVVRGQNVVWPEQAVRLFSLTAWLEEHQKLEFK